jgi:hypothetical protein
VNTGVDCQSSAVSKSNEIVEGVFRDDLVGSIPIVLGIGHERLKFMADVQCHDLTPMKWRVGGPVLKSVGMTRLQLAPLVLASYKVRLT